MSYYVYKITNTINGKWYIGKRKHHSPHNDRYMGSGKLIKLAIKKYGKNIFTKEIIEIFATNNDAAKLEAILVTKDDIKSNMTYNMHEGGHGGFAHLNDGSFNHIDRAKRGALKSTGNQHHNWGMYNFKVNTNHQKRASILGLNALKLLGVSDTTRKKISDYQKQNNSMKNKVWCVPFDANDYSLQKVFDIDKIPNGWIKNSVHRDLRKNKNNPVYGKFWIHEPTTRKNKYCSGIIPEGWIKGRLV